METTRVQTNSTERIEVLMLDSSNAAITSGTVTLKIRRKSDGQFWNGSAFQAGVMTVSMAEVSSANDPGKYFYSFNMTGLAADCYYCTATCAAAANVPQFGELKSGDYVDNLDKRLSSMILSMPVGIVSSAMTEEEKQIIITSISDLSKLLEEVLHGQKSFKEWASEIVDPAFDKILKEVAKAPNYGEILKSVEESGRLVKEGLAATISANAAEMIKALDVAPDPQFGEIKNTLALIEAIVIKNSGTQILEEVSK
jgi:hypothetical protein